MSLVGHNKVVSVVAASSVGGHNGSLVGHALADLGHLLFSQVRIVILLLQQLLNLLLCLGIQLLAIGVLLVLVEESRSGQGHELHTLVSRTDLDLGRDSGRVDRSGLGLGLRRNTFKR